VYEFYKEVIYSVSDWICRSAHSSKIVTRKSWVSHLVVLL